MSASMSSLASRLSSRTSAIVEMSSFHAGNVSIKFKTF